MIRFELRECQPWYARVLPFLKHEEPPLCYYVANSKQKASMHEVEEGYRRLNAVGYRVWLAPGLTSTHMLPAAGTVVDLEEIGGKRYVHVEGDDLETHLFSADDFHAKYWVETNARVRHCN